MRMPGRMTLVSTAALALIAAGVTVGYLGPRLQLHRAIQHEMTLHMLPGGWEGFLASIPEPSEAQNAAPVYLEASAALKALPSDVHLAIGLADEPSELVTLDLATAVERGRPAIELAHEAVRRPAFHIPVAGLTTEQFLDRLLSQLPAARAVLSLLQAEAIAAAQAGDPDQAAAILAEGLAVADHLATYPLALTLASREAADAFVIRTLREHCASAGGGLAEFERVLAQRDWLQSAHHSMLIERQFMTAEQAEDSDAQPLGEALRYFRDNFAAIEAAKRPFHEDPIPASLPGYPVNAEGVEFEVPSMLSMVRQAAVTQARNNLALSAIKLRLHYLEVGEHPASFVPLADPFTGQPLTYEKTATGFVLRSQATDLEGDPLEWRWE